MSHISPFADPGRRRVRSQSLRASLHGQIRKRKRDKHDDDEEDSDHSAGNDDVPSTRATSAITTLSAAEANQFRVAGFDPEDRLPPPPFPHAPAASPNLKFTPLALHQELAALKPPLYAPGLSSTTRFPTASSKDPNPNLSYRKRHLHRLMTIMHHCLLKGDYQRAGRAWRMILSAGESNTAIDPRPHARWGIEAEMRLHCGSENNVDRTINAPLLDADDAIFTEEGFKAAREYYESLIIKYPFHQSQPRVTNDLTFYPAMFGMWIYEVSQVSRTAIAAAENSDSPEEEREAQILTARTDELRRAREIAARLDDRLSHPHYDKRADFLHLRGMLHLWIGDLIAEISQLERNIDAEVSSEEVPENRVNAEREEHVAKAKEMFKRAVANGGRLSGDALQLLGDV